VYSNLAVQWCQDLEALFRELRRVLRPGGWVAFSTLLEGTLTELKSSWQQVDNYVHVNQFYSQQAWRQAAQSAGLGIAQWRLQPRREHYRELRQLLRELKALGAHNVNAGMPGGLTGKRSWQQLRYAYEQYRQQDGQLPASWQVLYAVLTHD
jgi:malonyl-CoA O-methyltransferase